MNTPTRRLPAAAVIGAAVLAFGLSGCDRGEPVSPPSAPVPAPSVGSAGSDGLTVRYLDADGKIKTLDVEDFPR